MPSVIPTWCQGHWISYSRTWESESEVPGCSWDATQPLSSPCLGNCELGQSRNSLPVPDGWSLRVATVRRSSFLLYHLTFLSFLRAWEINCMWRPPTGSLPSYSPWSWLHLTCRGVGLPAVWKWLHTSTKYLPLGRPASLGARVSGVHSRRRHQPLASPPNLYAF